LKRNLRENMILETIKDDYLLHLFKSLPPDRIEIFMLDHGNYRGAILHGTRMINQMRANHGYGPLETIICGHAYLAAGLMTSFIKGRDRIELRIQCEGPVGGISAESTAEGMVRGYLENSPIPADSYENIYDISPLIGEGVLSITKKIERAKQPFTGWVSLEHGNIAQDLTYYFFKSEQKPTAFNLSVKFDDWGRVIGAGGLMIQAFPLAEDAVSAELDTRVRNLSSLGDLFSRGKETESILMENFSDISPVIIGERDVRFYCHCSKERFARFLSAMPIDEIEDIRDKGPFPLKTTCHNCNSTYEFSREEMEEVYKMSR